jgi:Lipase C-terminal domain
MLTAWQLRAATGKRVGPRPAAKKRLGGNGSWGPFKLERGAHYEFAISRSTGTHHVYYEPFQHDNHLVRLLTAEPNTGLDALTEKSDRHAVLVVTRNKELWGDRDAANDVLTIAGTNVINAATSPAIEAHHRAVRLRRRLGRADQCERTAAGVLLAALHQRRGSRDRGLKAA